MNKRKTSMKHTPSQSAGTLLNDLRQLIDEARCSAAIAVNAGLTLMYWRIGQRIRTDILGRTRAGYGEEIVLTLSRQLAADFGRGFEEKNLRRMMQFAEVFPDEQIVVSLVRHLSWTHFLALIPRQRLAGARVLCRNVPSRAMDCAHPA